MGFGLIIEACGPGPRPTGPPTGLRPKFEQRDWDHGPHRKVDVQGPNGHGDLVPYRYELID